MVDLYTSIKSAWGYCTKFEWFFFPHIAVTSGINFMGKPFIFWIQRYDFQAGIMINCPRIPKFFRAEAQVDWLPNFLQVLSASSEQLYEAPVAVAYEVVLTPASDQNKDHSGSPYILSIKSTL